MNKILDLIFEDVKNENETKKTAVTLRISALHWIFSLPYGSFL